MADGTLGPFCHAHVAQAAAKATKVAELPAGSPVPNHLKPLLEMPIFDPKNPPMTQDEISRGRALLVLKLENGLIKSDVANAMLRALKEQSEHIEMYGGEQGAEGGSRVLRLMPGVTIVEQHDPSTIPLTMEELKLILEGQEFDRKNGVKPPESFAECVVRYIGRPRAATTLYDKHQDPEGVREYTETGGKVITFAQMEQRARSRWERLIAEGKKRASKDAKREVGEKPEDEG